MLGMDILADFCRPLVLLEKRILQTDREVYGLVRSREVGLKQAAGKVICIAVTDTDVARGKP